MGNGLFLVLLLNFGLFIGANLLHIPALAALTLDHWRPQWWQVRGAGKGRGGGDTGPCCSTTMTLNPTSSCQTPLMGPPLMTNSIRCHLVASPSPQESCCFTHFSAPPPTPAPVRDRYLHARQLAAPLVQRFFPARLWPHGGGGCGPPAASRGCYQAGEARRTRVLRSASRQEEEGPCPAHGIAPTCCSARPGRRRRARWACG